VLDTAGYVWTRAVNPILAAVMRDRDNRPDIWPQSLRSDYHSASCQQGAVHIWVLAFRQDDIEAASSGLRRDDVGVRPCLDQNHHGRAAFFD